MKLLYVGESWLGSCARSLKDALVRHPGVTLDELNEDLCFPKPQARWLRALNRLTAGAYRREFNAQVMTRLQIFRPDAVMVYKGYPVHADLLAAIRGQGVPSVNVYPDYSPQAYGEAHREAVGLYDLVITTKAYHPGLWQSLYGYRNQCEFVPQGYDPALHLVPPPPTEQPYDVVLVGAYRPEYGRLMIDLAGALGDAAIRVAIGGKGWEACRAELPGHWRLMGPVQGRSYIELLRQGRICIAPLNTEVVIQGRKQPGDVDTTRSYELAAAHCFFVHKRTDFAMSLYDPTEAPMFDDAAELARQIRYFLAHDAERIEMAAAAHRRAVPAYSMDARAEQIVGLLETHFGAARSAASLSL